MSQASYTIPANQDGTDFRNEVNAANGAMASHHKGSTAPTYAVAGMIWVDDSAGTTWTFKAYDGTDWTIIGTLDTTANFWTPANVALISGANSYVADSSITANSITANFSPAFTALTAGLPLKIKVANSVTGATTINVNSLGNVALKKNGSTAIGNGDIVSGQVIHVIFDGTNFQLLSPIAAPVGVYPTGYHGSSVPIYQTASTISLAGIHERDSSDLINIAKNTSTTVTYTSTGLNGVAQSANLTGTVTVTASSTTVTFSASQAGVIQAGDVITTAGGQSRRLVSGAGTSWVSESAFTSTETAVTVKRGGKAPNTFYYLYAISDGVTPGLLASTRNVAAGDTLVDLPSGYLYSAQLPFNINMDSSGNIIPFRVGAGWPWKPWIQFIKMENVAGYYRILNAFSTASFVTVNCSGLVPPVSRLVDLEAEPTRVGGAEASFFIRETGSGLTTGRYFTEQATTGFYVQSVLPCAPVNASQQFDIRANASASSINAYVTGYTITEIP